MKSVVIAIICLALGSSAASWLCSRLDQERTEELMMQNALDTSGLLLEYAEALQAPLEARNHLLKDLNDVRIQSYLSILWGYRDRSITAYEMALVLHEYMTKRGISPNKNVLLDPALWGATLPPRSP